MHQKVLFFLFLLASSPLCAENDALVTALELTQGYRRDMLDIRSSREIAGGASHIKNKFKHINIYSSRLALFAMKNGYFLKGIAGYGRVLNGKFSGVEHMDREGVSHRYRYQEHLHRKGHVHGEYTADFAIKLGKKFSHECGWTIAPDIGYGYYVQKFNTHRGHFEREQRLSRHRLRIAERKMDGISPHEHVRARWYSPQLGVNVSKACANSVHAYAQYDLLYPLVYRAKVTHTGPSHFRFLEHTQKNRAWQSFGNIGTLGVDWNFANGWHLKPECEAMLFYSRGHSERHHIKFKKARLTTVEVRLALSYTF